MYILFNLEPSKSHVGGAWYSDQALDQSVILSARITVEKLLGDNAEGLSLSSVTQKVNEYKCCNVHIFFYVILLLLIAFEFFSLISFVDFTEEDIIELLNSMACDGVITEVTDMFVSIFLNLFNFYRVMEQKRYGR